MESPLFFYITYKINCILKSSPLASQIFSLRTNHLFIHSKKKSMWRVKYVSSSEFKSRSHSLVAENISILHLNLILCWFHCHQESKTPFFSCKFHFDTPSKMTRTSYNQSQNNLKTTLIPDISYIKWLVCWNQPKLVVNSGWMYKNVNFIQSFIPRTPFFGCKFHFSPFAIDKMI